MIGIRLCQPAACLAYEFLRRRFTGASCRYRCRARFGSGQRLIVDLLRHFALVDQKFVALEIVLGFYVVGFGGLHLRVGGSKLALGGDDPRVGVVDAGRGESQLAGGAHVSNGNCNVE